MLYYKMKNKVGNLRESRLNILSNSVCALASNIRNSQKFNQKIWQKNKLRKFTQNLRFLNRGS